MSTAYRPTLAALTRHRGVLGSLVIDGSAGLVVDSHLRYGVHGDALAALAGALYRKARLSAGAAGLGAVTFLALEADGGHVCVAGHDELALVTLAEARANVGLLRAAMIRAAEGL